MSHCLFQEICEVLGFNNSPLYYRYPKNDPCEGILRDEIEQLAARYLTYGYRRITELLLRQGYSVGHRPVTRLMKAQNLSVSVKRVCQTTNSLEGRQPWVNRVENLEVSRANQVWIDDITPQCLFGLSAFECEVNVSA